MASRRENASRGVLAWMVRHRAFDAGVHRLQHVERFGAAALADDDAVRPHAERGAHQLRADSCRLALFRLGGRVSNLTTCALLQLQFGRVFDGDDALLFGNEARERVERAWSCRSRCRRR